MTVAEQTGFLKSVLAHSEIGKALQGFSLFCDDNVNIYIFTIVLRYAGNFHFYSNFSTMEVHAETLNFVLSSA